MATITSITSIFEPILIGIIHIMFFIFLCIVIVIIIIIIIIAINDIFKLHSDKKNKDVYSVLLYDETEIDKLY